MSDLKRDLENKKEEHCVECPIGLDDCVECGVCDHCEHDAALDDRQRLVPDTDFARQRETVKAAWARVFS